MSDAMIVMQLLDAHPDAELSITKRGQMYYVLLREEIRVADSTYGQGLSAAQQGGRRYRELCSEQQMELSACLHLLRNRLATIAAQHVDEAQRYLDAIGGMPSVEVP